MTNQVFVPAGGVIFEIIDDTAVTSATQVVPPESLTLLGLVAKDGFTQSKKVTTENIQELNSGRTARKIVTDQSESLKVTLLESTEAVLALVHGSASVSGIRNVDLTKVFANKRIVIDLFDKNFEGGTTVRTVRRVYENATLDTVGDVTSGFGKASTYDVTFVCEPDDSGYTSVEYIDDESIIVIP